MMNRGPRRRTHFGPRRLAVAGARSRGLAPAVVVAFSLGCTPGGDGSRVPPTAQTSSPSDSGPARPALDATVALGQSFELPDGSKLRIERHGHKDVTAEMGPSPLILEGTFTRAGASPEAFRVFVELRGSRTFTVEDERFEVIDHVYGASTHLRALGRSTR